MDVSVVGWGAHIGEALISNVWIMEEKELHINVLELEAVRLALLQNQKEISGKSVLIATDNTTCAGWLSRCYYGPRTGRYP
jgi:hypothetical protein